MAIKSRLERYNKMAVFAKSIELITLTALTLLKELYIQSKNSCSSYTSSLFRFYTNQYIESSILSPYFIYKNFIRLMNNHFKNNSLMDNHFKNNSLMDNHFKNNSLKQLYIFNKFIIKNIFIDINDNKLELKNILYLII
jgi:hypothetical protein